MSTGHQDTQPFPGGLLFHGRDGTPATPARVRHHRIDQKRTPAPAGHGPEEQAGGGSRFLGILYRLEGSLVPGPRRTKAVFPLFWNFFYPSSRLPVSLGELPRGGDICTGGRRRGQASLIEHPKHLPLLQKMHLPSVLVLHWWGAAPPVPWGHGQCLGTFWLS